MPKSKITIFQKMNGEKLNVFYVEDTFSPMRLFAICRRNDRYMLKFAKIKEHATLLKKFKPEVVLKLKTSLFRHLLREKNLAMQFTYEFEYTETSVENEEKIS